MPYMKSTLISKPVESAFGVSESLGVEEALGIDWGTVSSVGSGVLNFFGAGLKAQGAQEALAEQMKAAAGAAGRSSSAARRRHPDDVPPHRRCGARRSAGVRDAAEVSSGACRMSTRIVKHWNMSRVMTQMLRPALVSST